MPRLDNLFLTSTYSHRTVEISRGIGFAGSASPRSQTAEVSHSAFTESSFFLKSDASTARNLPDRFDSHFSKSRISIRRNCIAAALVPAPKIRSGISSHG